MHSTHTSALRWMAVVAGAVALVAAAGFVLRRPASSPEPAFPPRSTFVMTAATDSTAANSSPIAENRATRETPPTIARPSRTSDTRPPAAPEPTGDRPTEESPRRRAQERAVQSTTTATSPSSSSSSSSTNLQLSAEALQTYAWALRSPTVRLCHQACVAKQDIGRIYFVHMRKAGGSTLEQYLGTRVGATVYDPDKNGLPGNRLVMATAASMRWSLKSGLNPDGQENVRRFRFGREQQLSLMWNEMALVPAQQLAQERIPQVFVTHLRDPVSRLQSRYKMWLRRDNGVVMVMPNITLLEWVTEMREDNRRKAEYISNARMPDQPQRRRLPSSLFVDIASNYYTKRLALAARPGVDELSCSEIIRMLRTEGTRADLELAKVVLSQFDEVLIADNALGTAGEQELMDEHFGAIKPSPQVAKTLLEGGHKIPKGISTFHANTVPRSRNDSAFERATRLHASEDLKVLRSWNTLDTDLMLFARRLAAERAENLVRGGSVAAEDAWLRTAAALPSAANPGAPPGAGAAASPRARKGGKVSGWQDLDAAVPGWCKLQGGAQGKQQAVCNYKWAAGDGTHKLHVEDTLPIINTCLADI